MKDWFRKVSTPTRSRVSDTEHGALEIAPEMEWEDAPDTEKAWRFAVAKEKTELSQSKFMINVMVMESFSIDCACELFLVHCIVLATSLGKYTSLSLEFEYRSCILWVGGHYAAYLKLSMEILGAHHDFIKDSLFLIEISKASILKVLSLKPELNPIWVGSGC